MNRTHRSSSPEQIYSQRTDWYYCLEGMVIENGARDTSHHGHQAEKDSRKCRARQSDRLTIDQQHLFLRHLHLLAQAYLCL